MRSNKGISMSVLVMAAEIRHPEGPRQSFEYTLLQQIMHWHVTKQLPY